MTVRGRKGGPFGAMWKEALLARLQLVRLPNLFTAMADVLAGYLIVAGATFRGGTLAWLLASSAALYAAGCVLNDIFDQRIDAVERPFRPLPSGRVSLREAIFLCMALFALGLAAALAAGQASFLVATLLALMILSYDGGMKHRAFLGPLNMGACRAANLILGMAPVLEARALSPDFSVEESWLIFPALTFLYVLLLTRLSRFEVGGARSRPWTVAIGWTALVLGMVYLVSFGRMSAEALPYLALFALLTGPALFRGISRPQPDLVGRAVKMLILGIPLLDAVYVAGGQGWEFGAPVALLVLPAVLLARVLYVT